MSSIVLAAFADAGTSRSRKPCDAEWGPSARSLAPPQSVSTLCLYSFLLLPSFFFFSVVPFLLLSSVSPFLSFVSVSLQINEEGNSLRIESNRKQFQPWHWTLCRLV